MPFDHDTVDAVLAHMNDHHAEDSLTIVRAHGYPAATSAEMTSLDEHGATWHVVDGHAEAGVRVSWPSGPLHEAAGVRREVVALHAAARSSLGLGLAEG